MATVTSYFDEFLAKIRLTSAQRKDCKQGHTVLRQRLEADPDLKDKIVTTFLQGSYRRATAIRPSEESEKSDVDVVVVTNIDRATTTPSQALDLFEPFLKKHYAGKYTRQGRSWHIGLSYVELDLVPTSAPSEVAQDLLKSMSVQMTESIDEVPDWRLSRFWKPGQQTLSKSLQLQEAAAEEKWRKEPLWIPDRDAAKWDKTHPLEQLRVTVEKNGACNGEFVDVVKCLKWWRTTEQPVPKYPKSYPLEHMLWIHCPDGIECAADGVVQALEHIRDTYQTYATTKTTPYIADHGIPDHNVLGRVSGEDFAAFHGLVTDAAGLARRAYDEPTIRRSVEFWRALFGEKFPEPPPDDGGTSRTGGFTPRREGSRIESGRFA